MSRPTGAFLHWIWAFAIFAFYTDPDESCIWVSEEDDDTEPSGKMEFIYFATTRPVVDESQVICLSSYGWEKVDAKRDGQEWPGSVFRKPAW